MKSNALIPSKLGIEGKFEILKFYSEPICHSMSIPNMARLAVAMVVVRVKKIVVTVFGEWRPQRYEKYGHEGIALQHSIGNGSPILDMKELLP